MSVLAIPLVVLLTVIAGSCLQRVSGMGLGLIGGPILTLFLGPVEGIMVINVLACLNAILTTYSMRENVDWGKWLRIGPFMVLGSIPAALLIARIDTAALLVLVGAALLIALAVVVFGRKFVPEMSGTGPAISAGILGGFTNTLAGVAGPVITVYAQAARWPKEVLAPTLQPCFVIGGLSSVLTKYFLGSGGFDGLHWLVWPCGVIGMCVGILLGKKIAGRVSRDKAHKLSLWLATLGALSALLRGLFTLGA